MFVAVAVTLLLFLVFLWVAIRSLRLDREMDKVIELNRFQDFSPEMSMRKLGPLGKKITALYYQLNALNEKKSLKISAQSELVSFLVNNSDLPLAVTDVTGGILWVSPPFPDKVGKGKTEIVGNRIDTMLQDISIQNIIFEMGRLHGSLEKTSGKSEVTCYPMHNRANDLSYLVFVLGKKAVYTEKKRGSESSEGAGPKSTGLQRALSRLLSRHRQGQ